MRRWGEPLGGLVFAVLAVAALVLFGDPPGSGASAQGVLFYYTGNAPAVLLGDALWVGAAAGLGAFLLAARHRVEPGPQHHPWLSAAGSVAAATGVVLFALSAVLGGILALAAATGQAGPAAALDLWRQENASLAVALPFLGVAVLEIGLGLWHADAPARAVALATAALGILLMIPGLNQACLPLLLVWAAAGTFSLLLGELEHLPAGRRAAL